MQRNRGFTLIEILVVMAIVAVLSALLFPVVGRVREKGRQATCQSNLKQIYKGMMLYIQDNDSQHAPGMGWWDSIALYTKAPSLKVCPSTPQPPLSTYGLPDHYSGAYILYGGFMHNFVAQTPDAPSKRSPLGVNEAVLADASKIFVHSDQAFFGHFQQISMPRADACGMTVANGSPHVIQDVSTIHNGGGNHLFYDGHVKWMTPEQFVVAACEAAPFLQPPFRAGGEHF